MLSMQDLEIDEEYNDLLVEVKEEA